MRFNFRDPVDWLELGLKALMLAGVTAAVWFIANYAPYSVYPMQRRITALENEVRELKHK